ncbi:Endoplasmic reticulum-Golgi intermediate compartment protein 2 [Chelonia mydas]|uniref:Endoplasmic reticulum-Golgi intermediate compartment protein n=1 Tax=Chelonia mydas TaxID=8469 RepID=M7B4C4_CHEMY|nr:Endoplasmic reticulum-Golgi intermediate compartment protein 2 [Chelonia mydas]
MRRLNRKKTLNLMKELDAFPKVPESYVETSTSGGTDVGADVLDLAETMVVSADGLVYEPVIFDLTPQQREWQRAIPHPRGHAHLAALVSHDSYNFSHRIDHLSFGELIPGIINPLDGTEKIASDQSAFHGMSLPHCHQDGQIAEAHTLREVFVHVLLALLTALQSPTHLLLVLVLHILLDNAYGV